MLHKNRGFGPPVFLPSHQPHRRKNCHDHIFHSKCFATIFQQHHPLDSTITCYYHRNFPPDHRRSYVYTNHPAPHWFVPDVSPTTYSTSYLTIARPHHLTIHAHQAYPTTSSHSTPRFGPYLHRLHTPRGAWKVRSYHRLRSLHLRLASPLRSPRAQSAAFPPWKTHRALHSLCTSARAIKYGTSRSGASWPLIFWGSCTLSEETVTRTYTGDQEFLRELGVINLQAVGHETWDVPGS